MLGSNFMFVLVGWVFSFQDNKVWVMVVKVCSCFPWFVG